MKHAKGTAYKGSQGLRSKAEICRNGKGCKAGQSICIELDEKSRFKRSVEFDAVGVRAKTFVRRSAHGGMSLPDDVFTDLFSRPLDVESFIPQVASNPVDAFHVAMCS
jgi:hypothetical protein